MSKKKERLDVLVFERGFVESREKAKRLIMTGNVFVNGQREDKAGLKIDTTLEITVKTNPNPYVSRGGLKLVKVVEKYKLQLQDKVCMDVGASTGGFTDCMLQHGASKIFAIDVGRGQLDWKLRQDRRVISMERTNIRHVTPEQFDEKMDFVSIDVSFISLIKIYKQVIALMKEESEMVCLIKPQFEAGREKVGKKGVVRDKKVHQAVIERIIEEVENLGMVGKGLDFSPIKGPKGNIEYLLYLGRGKMSGTIELQNQVSLVVETAHNQLMNQKDK